MLNGVFPVRIGQDVYDVRTQIDPVKAPYWQSVLSRAKVVGAQVHCLCLQDGQALLLSVHEREGRYHLQSFPNQGDSHAIGCRFHRAATGPANAFPRSPDELPLKEPPEEPVVDRLPLGFAIPTQSPSIRGSSSSGAKHVARVRRVSLDQLLIALWERAGLNEWKASWQGKRNTFTVLNRLRTAATEITINGEQLAANLLIGELDQGGKADRHNGAVIERAIGTRRRVLVLGRLAAAKHPLQPLSPLRLRNYHGTPFFLMSAEVVSAIEKEHRFALAEWRNRQRPVFALVMAEPSDRGRWFVVDAGLLMCDDRFVRYPKA